MNEKIDKNLPIKSDLSSEKRIKQIARDYWPIIIEIIQKDFGLTLSLADATALRKILNETLHDKADKNKNIDPISEAGWRFFQERYGVDITEYLAMAKTNKEKDKWMRDLSFLLEKRKKESEMI